jgi:hypothetical protein
MLDDQHRHAFLADLPYDAQNAGEIVVALAIVQLHPQRHKRAQAGHPWI